VVFLWLTMLLVAAPVLVLVILNAPPFQSMVNSGFALMWAVFLLPPALGLLALIYLRVTVAEQSQAVPGSH